MVLNRDRSAIAVTTFGTSQFGSDVAREPSSASARSEGRSLGMSVSHDIPAQSVAQKTKSCSCAIALSWPWFTSRVLPNSPCPYSDGRAGLWVAAHGTLQVNLATYVLPGSCIGSFVPGAYAKPPPGWHSGEVRKHGTSNVPVTRRAIGPLPGAKSSTFVTLNRGALPVTLMSARFVSPSCPNASERMCSMRSDRLFSLATVKSHAR